MSDYKPGKIVKGIITGVQKYGIFVDLDNYYSGLIHISEISTGFIKDVKKHVKIGDKINARIIDLDEKSKHLSLSIKIFEKVRKPRIINNLPPNNIGSKSVLNNLEYWLNNKGDWYDKV